MKARNIVSLFASVLFAILSATRASAQLQRTFVSGAGNDSNACTRLAPCRTFGQALMGTSAGGEVVVLDSAGYGAFAIVQAVSIIAPPGVYAGISAFSGDGIDINAGGSDTVTLRGLTLNSQGSTGDGIVFTTGGTLHVEGCVINGFTAGTGNGIFFKAAGTLEVKDSIMRGNNTGILVSPASGTAVAAIDQVRLEGGQAGLEADGGSKVTVRNSLASGNSGIGFLALSTSSALFDLNIENCVASNNGQGILVTNNVPMGTGAGTVRVSSSTVTDNGIGLQQAGTVGVLKSRRNNTLEGNTTQTVGIIGFYTAK